jgi:hypothetical protein
MNMSLLWKYQKRREFSHLSLQNAYDGICHPSHIISIMYFFLYIAASMKQNLCGKVKKKFHGVFQQPPSGTVFVQGLKYEHLQICKEGMGRDLIQHDMCTESMKGTSICSVQQILLIPKHGESICYNMKDE